MKKLAVVAAAFLMAIPPLALPTPTAAAAMYDRDRDGDRGGRSWRDRDRDRSHRYQRRNRNNHRAHRSERRRHGAYYRRHHARADHRRHRSSRSYYRSRPSYYSSRHRDGYRRPYARRHVWRRGDRLPAYYRSRYVVIRDYDRYHLRRPPRGCYWVRDDSGRYLLVAIATGVILGIALGSSGYY
jgi:Ni/Co efflux regulator RcnB